MAALPIPPVVDRTMNTYDIAHVQYLSVGSFSSQICRILSNPSLLRSMIQGTSLASNEVLVRKLEQSVYLNLHTLLSYIILSCAQGP